MINPPNEHDFGDFDDTDLVPKYRAIGIQNSRQGLRLENAYWDCLKQIAKESNCTIGNLVESARIISGSKGNLTSTLRVACLNWLTGRLQASEQMMSNQMIRNTVYACPSPALALSSDKRLHSFNQPFHRLITDKFSILDRDHLPPKMKLLLDIQIGDLIDQLRLGDNKPILTGVVIGVDNRTFRAKLTTVMAATAEQNVILGYLLT
ncbi:MAG: ribbon-helix-helix domain-containing protein [Rhizobiaceae bacterium]